MTVMAPRTGLVLLSGGARGAYQAGVLRALSEVLKTHSSPFPIITGISAGAINAVHLAMHASDFQHAATTLAELWESFHFEDVFDTSTLHLAKRSARWFLDLSSGGAFGTGRGLSLLDASPLGQRLSKLFDRTQIETHFSNGRLHAVAVTATHYPRGTSVTFFEGDSQIQPWQRATRVGVRANLTLRHVLASAAIPIFFSAIELEGHFYGDGAIRMTTPLSPALHLGADRLVAIALHPQDLAQFPEALPESSAYPTMAELGGVLMNSIFLPTLDADVERLRRINRTLEHVQPGLSTSLRKIPILVLRPSRDLGSLVQDVLSVFPQGVKHLLRGLGATEHSGFELLSYLAFEPAYTQRLLELGYQDALEQRQKIEDFFIAST